MPADAGFQGYLLAPGAHRVRNRLVSTRDRRIERLLQEIRELRLENGELRSEVAKVYGMLEEAEQKLEAREKQGV